MASRYLVTGCQLGALKGFLQVGNEKTTEKALEEIEKILNEQYVGYSDGNVCDDSVQLSRKFND